MLGCKAGLIFQTFENDALRGGYMAEGVSTATICRTSKNCFQGYDDVRVFL